MKVCVIGAGTMGSGIAQLFAATSHETLLCDIKQEFVDKGYASIERNLGRLVSKEKIGESQKEEILSNITCITDVENAKGAKLVVEAIIENMSIKKELFQKLDEIVGDQAVLATNTSSLSITELAAATKNPQRVVGMHFFNPAPVMKLVEIVKGLTTSDETQKKVVKITKALGKEGVIVNEAPGFVVNRILIPMINEAVGILAEGIASAADIDNAMKFGANHPIGPLALADLIGNDVNLAIMNELHEAFGDPKYRAHPLLKKMVRAGHLGRKTGKGFFVY